MKSEKIIKQVQKLMATQLVLPMEVLTPHTALGDVGLDNLEVKETIKMLEKKFAISLYHYPITLSTTISNVACFVEQAKKAKSSVWFHLKLLGCIFVVGGIVVFVAKTM